MKGSKAIGVTIDIELVERCDRLRLAGQFKHWSIKRFREMILEIGMDKYESMYPQRKAPECQTEIECEKARIIPFPFMRYSETETPAEDFQTQLDNFLREMGYIN
jgi:hypothetical protein